MDYLGYWRLTDWDSSRMDYLGYCRLTDWDSSCMDYLGYCRLSDLVSSAHQTASNHYSVPRPHSEDMCTQTVINSQ